jgi:hypothetical protein
MAKPKTVKSTKLKAPIENATTTPETHNAESTAPSAPTVAPKVDAATAIALPDVLTQFHCPVNSEEQIHRATAACELRVNELRQLHGQLSDVTGAASRLQLAPQSFRESALLIHDTLDRTIGYRTVDLSANPADRVQLIQLSADCLFLLNQVLSVWQFIDASSQFRIVSRALYSVLEQEQIGDRYNEELHYLEEGIWEDCLPEMLHEIDVVTARLSLYGSQSASHPSTNEAAPQLEHKPSWDSGRRRLSFCESSARFATQTNRGYIPKIMAKFVSSDWTDRIENEWDNDHCRNALKTLNKKCRTNGLALEFSRDDKWICWKSTSEKCTPN